MTPLTSTAHTLSVCLTYPPVELNDDTLTMLARNLMKECSDIEDIFELNIDQVKLLMLGQTLEFVRALRRESVS
jgi:hypothetical protein